MLADIFDVDLSRADDHGVVTVRIHGDMDLSTSPRLRSALRDADERGLHRLLVDLRQVDYVDSSGLGVLLGALRRARQGGGDLRIAASAPVARLLDLVGLSDLLRVDDLHQSCERSEQDDRGSASDPGVDEVWGRSPQRRFCGGQAS